jgi:hypothetical protein
MMSEAERWFNAMVREWVASHPAPERPPRPPEPSAQELRLRREARERERAARAARLDGLRATGVPDRWVRRLAAGGFASAAEVAEASDAMLLRCPQVGRLTLEAIRDRYPARAWSPPWWVAEE